MIHEVGSERQGEADAPSSGLTSSLWTADGLLGNGALSWNS